MDDRDLILEFLRKAGHAPAQDRNPLQDAREENAAAPQLGADALYRWEDDDGTPQGTADPKFAPLLKRARRHTGPKAEKK